MEKKLKEIYLSYSSKEDKMKLPEYKKLLTDRNICPPELIDKIYNGYCINKVMSFSSFKMSLKEIAIRTKTKEDTIKNKIITGEDKEEVKRITQKKKEIFEMHDKIKNNKNMKPDEKVKITLENMCFMGDIMKKEIEKEKKENPEKFIPIEEAIKEKSQGTNFCLGVLAQKLENIGITTAIEKEGSKTEEDKKKSEMVLEYIMNGMADRKKFDFQFDFGAKRNNELLTDKNEEEKFHKKLKKAISLQNGVKEENILITNPHKGSYIVQVIFLKEDFNKEINMSKFKELCNEEEFKELTELKNIHKQLIMDGCKLTPEMLDPEGNRKEGWEEGGKRGCFDYFPPVKDWIGFGLKVRGKYDNGNDDWLDFDGNSNEWAVAYHGVGSGVTDNLEDIANKIAKGGLKPGSGQVYENAEDRFHPGNKVGRGVYCSPNPDVLEEYASQAKTKTKVNGKQYMIGFMLRVKPDKIRSPKDEDVDDYWVLNGTTDEVRPYRILVKEYK